MTKQQQSTGHDSERDQTRSHLATSNNISNNPAHVKEDAQQKAADCRVNQESDSTIEQNGRHVDQTCGIDVVHKVSGKHVGEQWNGALVGEVLWKTSCTRAELRHMAP